MNSTPAALNYSIRGGPNFITPALLANPFNAALPIPNLEALTTPRPKAYLALCLCSDLAGL